MDWKISPGKKRNVLKSSGKQSREQKLLLFSSPHKNFKTNPNLIPTTHSPAEQENSTGHLTFTD
jgi:hypothetical protein